MRTFIVSLLFLFLSFDLSARTVNLQSPDGQISLDINLSDGLFYSVSYKGKQVINPSPLGFEFQNEPAMHEGFALLNAPQSLLKSDSWTPVVKNKHARVDVRWNETHLALVEKEGEKRRMDLFFRVYDNGVAFRYRLYGSPVIGDRAISRELTGFSVPSQSQAWVAEYWPAYTSSQESEFNKRPVTGLTAQTVAGLPMLIEVDKENYLAVTEAHIDNYPGFYIGREADDNQGQVVLTTKLSPLPGEKEDGVKARFSDKIYTPWRVVMVGDNPGRFIESEIVQSLNPPCAIEDPSWIQPGICAWDHWWSGEVKMEMPVIKEYIDFAAAQGWPYMLIDWQWYGPFNRPEADITKPAPQIDMPEILAYAREKNVRIWLWLYNTDVNRNNAFEEAFALYRQWGIAGVKIDFMDRDDQEMVNWYRKVIKKAAENRLMVNFHGSYKPDGIERTYPNMITREGVLGEEYSKFSDRIIPAHNVTLPFTRMLAGPMDYTPGGFLNVTPEQFRQQSPTLVMNTRCGELSKFVIYESPFTVFCDHPRHVSGQPGSDFLQIVPTVWDDTRFIDGYPGEFIVLAKRSGKEWFIGAMNNNVSRTVTIPTDFLSAGKYELEYWEDAKDAGKNPAKLRKNRMVIEAGKPIKIQMAGGGGYVAVLTQNKQEQAGQGKFEPTWESLSQYETPEWFRNAKFGIWAHWGPQCQPEAGDWYGRAMYEEGGDAYNRHLEKYGHPSEFGFKDVINEWKAEKWDPEKLVALYKRTGARYFFAMGNHHDNMDLWDSKYQSWNSVNMGPKRDVLAEWEKAARKNDLPFGVSIHSSHAWTWYETGQGADKKGPYAGIPYDARVVTKEDGKGKWWEGYDPQELYVQNHALSGHSWVAWDWPEGTSVPTQAYYDNFYDRTVDMISRYNPDLVYFDDSVLPFWPINSTGMEVVANYYNQNMKRNDGKLDAVVFGKKLQEEHKEAIVWDVEKGVPSTLQEKAWQTCTCLGSWHYHRSAYEDNWYKSARTVIHMLVDIVSKNGNMLLSVPMKGDGTIDDKEEKILEDIAAWMDINKEAIFDTRPWRIFGEGPASETAIPLDGPGFNEGKNEPYTSEDIRFVEKGNILYAHVLEWPADGKVLIKSLASNSPHHKGKIKNVEMLGGGKAGFQRTDKGLLVDLPKDKRPNEISFVLKITN